MCSTSCTRSSCSVHVLQPQRMINASGCDAQFEQHRKVHLTDETYGRCVCFLVIHVDLCGRAVHDFDGTLHALNIVDLRARCACSCLLLATWWAEPSSRTARVGNPNLHFFSTSLWFHVQQSVISQETGLSARLRCSKTRQSLVPAMLLATWWVRPPSMTSGWAIRPQK